MSGLRKTGIEVKAGFFPMAFLLFLCKPVIEIDGTAHKKTWGEHFFELAPGQHQITVYFAYMGMPRCGENTISVDIPAETVTRINYYMPPWMYAKGSLKLS